MTTLLKDLLQLHDQSLQEKDVQTDADDDLSDYKFKSRATA
jgi:hypothetical protein